MSTFSVQGLPRSTSGAAHEKVPTWMHSQMRLCHTPFTHHTTLTAATGTPSKAHAVREERVICRDITCTKL